MDFTADPRTTELAAELRDFLTERVLPSAPVFARQAETSGWDTPAVLEELKAEARSRGL
jgi:acyl-CoA dehydrogenase